jgi:hypothetical protein
MSTTLDQYREAKNSYLKLRNQAKKELLARFHELSAELLAVQRELLEDFNEKVAIPTKSSKLKPVKKTPSPVAAPPQEPAAAPSPKVLQLRKQLDGLKTKLADAKAAGKPTKVLDDKIYEVEDSLRLAEAL